MRKFLLFVSLLMTTAALFAETRVLAFSGSTRKDSYNKTLLNEAAAIAKEMGATVTTIDLKDYPMPFYDGDLEAKGMPQIVKKFRTLMVNHDAIIIATPEYNGSLPAVLKNALDWASRSPTGGSSTEAFQGKKFAIMSASPGRGGGGRALAHLKGVIENVGGVVMPTQVTIPNAHNYFSKKDRGENPQLKEEIEELLQNDGT